MVPRMPRTYGLYELPEDLGVPISSGRCEDETPIHSIFILE